MVSNTANVLNLTDTARPLGHSRIAGLSRQSHPYERAMRYGR